MMFPLAGNERVRTAVGAFAARGRMPHALLITGGEGQGKNTLAKYIAAAAVCSGAGKRPCGECKNCRAVLSGNHPDVIYVDRESGKKEIGVSVIREIRSDAFIKPHEAESKVFIIRNADCMNTSAQNALLKVLEEPPENTHFILLAKNVSALLVTVLSRCTRMDLSSPAAEDGAAVLAELAGCNTDTANELLKLSNGSIGAALSLFKTGGKNSAKAAAEDFVKLIFSGSEYDMIKALAAAGKDRVSADAFFVELKTALAAEIKKLPLHGKRAKVLYGVYGETDKYIERLKSNVNLPLLFCSVAADISEYKR